MVSEAGIFLKLLVRFSGFLMECIQVKNLNRNQRDKMNRNSYNFTFRTFTAHTVWAIQDMAHSS